MKFRILLSLLCVGLIAACKRAENDNLLTQFTNYTLTNKNKMPVVVRIEDSVNHKAYYLQVAGLSKVQVPESILVRPDGSVAGLFYYWATQDRSVSSWYNKPFYQMRREMAFSYQSGRTAYNMDLETAVPNIAMRICLNGMDGSTVWKAVDAFDSSGKSIWVFMGASQRDHQVQLNYDMSGTYTHANNIGAPTTDYFGYTFYGYENYLHLYSTYYTTLETPKPEGFMQFRNDNKRTDVVLRTTGTDSVFMCLNGNYPYYLMVKQKVATP